MGSTNGEPGSACHSIYGAYAAIANGMLICPDESGGLVWRKAWGDLYGIISTWHQAYLCTSVAVSLKVDGELVYAYSSYEASDQNARIVWKDPQGNMRAQSFSEETGFDKVEPADELEDYGEGHETLIIDDAARILRFHG